MCGALCVCVRECLRVWWMRAFKCTQYFGPSIFSQTFSKERHNFWMEKKSNKMWHCSCECLLCVLSVSFSWLSTATGNSYWKIKKRFILSVKCVGKDLIKMTRKFLVFVKINLWFQKTKVSGKSRNEVPYQYNKNVSRLLVFKNG